MFIIIVNSKQQKTHLSWEKRKIPSLHIGISFRPFLRISVASSSVRP